MKPIINPKFVALIPPLSANELTQLEANLIADGCRDPLAVWRGQLLDGHHRLNFCDQHSLPFVTVEIKLADEAAAVIWIIRNQFGRRNITLAARCRLAKTLAEALKPLAKENQKARKGKQRGADKSANIGEVVDAREQAAKEAGVSHGSMNAYDYVEEHADQATMQEVLTNPDLKLHVVAKQLRDAELAEERTTLAKSASTIELSDRWKIHCADMAEWKSDHQFNWIITDPPYPKQFLPLYEQLARRANDWLKDGGVLVAMCGQSFLDEVYAMLSRHLTYYWTAAYLTPGQPKPLRQVNVNTTWKPLLMFTKGIYTGKIFGDVFKSDGNEKDFHKWGQSISGMMDIVSKLALPGQLILDPFCGAGTTGIAALRHGCLFEGVEIDEESSKIAMARLNDETK